jgi:hypothetical protein
MIDNIKPDRQDSAVNSIHTFRLGWKGVLSTAEWLLYADSDLSLWIFLPLFFFLFLPRLFLSYLRLSSQGVEIHYWPNYRESYSWSEIEHLGQCRTMGVMTCEALYLHHTSSASDHEIISRTAGLKQKRLIPLSDFRGWSHGRLARVLTRFIPEIID